MYTPKTFKENDPDTLLKIMRDNAFASIITTDEEGKPVATQLPFLIKQKNDTIVLQAHFAKVNTQWKHLESNSQVLVSFQGPHCYISPSWYEDSGVPTWDYVTVQTYGTAKLFESNQQTAELIEELTDKYEQVFDKTLATPWKAKNNYPDKMLNAIVGFEITVQEIREALAKFHELWQRQKLIIKAWTYRNTEIFYMFTTRSMSFWLSPEG